MDVDGKDVQVTPRTPENPSIGFTYDDADDTARLTLVTAYLGSQKQMQFVRVDDDNPFKAEGDPEKEVGAPILPDPADPEAPNLDDGRTDGGERTDAARAYTVEDGKIIIDHDGDGEAMDKAAVVDDDGEIATPATTAPVTVAPKLAGDHFVHYSADDTKTTESLYYVETGKKDVTAGKKDDGIDDTKLFLERSVKEGTTTYTRVGVIEVTIDNATAFKHIHYGLWNGLSGSDANTVADLGKGFVNALADGMGMTNPDHAAEGGMPNSGEATYNGNWVANIQEADEQGDGAITRHRRYIKYDGRFWDGHGRGHLGSPCHAGWCHFGEYILG